MIAVVLTIDMVNINVKLMILVLMVVMLLMVLMVIIEGFREFLANFVDTEGNSKYFNMIRELIDSGENILDASISDIKLHKKILMKLTNDLP